MLDLALLESHLKTALIGRAAGWENELWESIDSTNSRAVDLAKTGAPHGVIVLARQQTSGKGRLGRTWVSPYDAGMYISFILRPTCSQSDMPLFTLACGVAAQKAIAEATGLQIGLKWVNDLVLNGKKIGGILAELVQTVGKDQELKPALVIGVGININIPTDAIPDELQDRIDSLEHLCNKQIDVNLLAALLANYLEQLCSVIESNQKQLVLDAWRAASVTLGKQIQILSDTPQQGTAIDIDENGALIVETKDGKRTNLLAGEISIRNLDGSYS